MICPRRASSLVSLLLAVGCAAEPDEPTATAVGSTGSSTAATTGSTGATTGATTGGATGVDDGCPSHAVGEWNACKVGNQTMNSLCEWEEGTGEGMVLCLAPASGGLNVCGIRDCVDVCDCFAPPATGTAVPVCAPILGSGANGCALYCAGGQICPDGMTCHSGYCYWPN